MMRRKGCDKFKSIKVDEQRVQQSSFYRRGDAEVSAHGGQRTQSCSPRRDESDKVANCVRDQELRQKFIKIDLLKAQGPRYRRKEIDR